MLRCIALVGRPNVGKSTLFNKLTRTRDALVADVPGLTRDRRYGRMQLDEQTVMLVDTGGLYGDHALADELARQTRMAVDEADLVVLLLDAREGATASDEEVISYLRRENVPFIPVVNKIDGISQDMATAEFARFGFEASLFISASHSRGMRALTELLSAELEKLDPPDTDAGQVPVSESGIPVAIVGRPNVGKSTLVNRLVGEERQVVFDMPGTTRDAIDVPFERDGTEYVLIDTAGVRRKGKVEEIAEKFSVVKALQAMERAAVVILVLDATEGVVEQDLHVLRYAADAGAGLVLALNKWDGLDADTRKQVLESVDRKLGFVPWMPVMKISALHGTGVGHLFELVDEVYQAGRFDVSTSLLTRLLQNMVEAHPPPAVRGRRIKIKLATRAGAHPPRVAVHGNQLDALPASYVRYLENGYRESLDLVGNPVKIDMRTSDNPYRGKRNELTRRQQQRRRRVIKKSRR